MFGDMGYGKSADISAALSAGGEINEHTSELSMDIMNWVKQNDQKFKSSEIFWQEFNKFVSVTIGEKLYRKEQQLQGKLYNAFETMIEDQNDNFKKLMEHNKKFAENDRDQLLVAIRKRAEADVKKSIKKK